MPRTNFALMGENLSRVTEDIRQFTQTHNIPPEYFQSIPTEIHPVAKSAVRKLLILREQTVAFMQDICQVMRTHSAPDGNQLYGLSSRLQLKYPVIWNADKTGCIAFPNITMNNFNAGTSLRDVRSENPWYPRYTHDLIQRIMSDLEDDKRRNAWSPISRGIKRLNERQEMTVSRALARALLFRGEPIKDAQYIDNTAQHIIELHKPSTFVFADTVDEIREMYTRVSSETPSSCMDSKHGFSLDHPTRPVDFYGYCPTTRGAYIIRGDTILARTICWMDTVRKDWYYSRIYASRHANNTELKKFLEDAGVKDYSENSVRSYCQFSMPLSYHQGSPACPMPYFDQKPFSWLGVQLSDDGTHFVVKLAERKADPAGWEMPSLSSTYGSHVLSRFDDCVNCGTSINRDHDEYCYVSGDIYCTEGCAVDNDCVMYVMSNDSEMRYDRELPDMAVPAWSDHVWYSNRHAGLTRGMRYHPVPWAATEGDLFVFRFDANSDSLVRLWTQEMEVSPHHYMPQTMFVPEGTTPVRGNGNWSMGPDQAFQFLTMRIETVKKLPASLTTVTSPFAEIVGKQDFSDAMFDEHLEGILDTPAPLDDHAYYCNSNL